MIDFKRLAVFATVVELGSFGAAARRLGISTSAVSQHLRALEEAYGVTLLHRSTRKLGLTDAGLRVVRHCRAMLTEAGAAHEQLGMAHEAPSGQLRMSAPVGFARHVAPALAPLLAAHPGLKLHLTVADEMIDLIDARIDLALRAGRLADSNWVARRLCALEWLPCAAPSYLARFGQPSEPAELAAHDWLAVVQAEADLDLRLTGPDGSSQPLRVEPRITSNNHLALLQLCLAGLGIALMVRADIDEELRHGRLLPVLAGWRAPDLPVWAVTPRRDTEPAKVRFAIEALKAHFRQLPGACPD
jgi:DNA-binding transcriptional LysR family regulator